MELKEKIEVILKRRRQERDKLPAHTFNGLAEEISVSPPTLRLAVNDDDKLSKPYKDYIISKIDEKL